MSPSIAKRAEITIEDAKVEDVPAIAAIGRATFATSFGHSMPENDMQAYLDKSYNTAAIQAEFEDRKQHQFFVARSSETGAVAGFLQLQYGTTEPCLPRDMHLIEIYRVYVSSDFHGLGIGGKLLERAIETAKGIPGCQGAWLGVWEENHRAQRFYASYGFTEKVGEHSFTMGECVQWDWIVMLRF